MTLGIMQPYYFPYLGYWQLMAAADVYLIYDDVNYIKGGWINRNRILINGAPAYIRVPVVRASQNRRICELATDISPEFLDKTEKKIRFAYERAPYFGEVFPALMEMIGVREESLSRYLTRLIGKMAEKLHMKTEFCVASEGNYARGLHGERRGIAIASQFGADIYLNAPGGQKLYSYEHFREAGIQLKFVRPEIPPYRQFREPFIPDLSIIDVLMFNGWEGTERLLGAWRFIEEDTAALP